MILIIDDDIAVRTSLLLLLQQHGYKTAGTSNAAETLDFLQKQTPALIILDLNFSIETSGDEGMQLLQQIRKAGCKTCTRYPDHGLGNHTAGC